MAQTPCKSDQKLRRLAEEKVQQEDVTAHEVLSPESAEKLLHELRVHQVELKMQNEELRRSEHDMDLLRARYFDLYNLAPVGYLTLNEQGIIAEANLTSANLLGVVKGELVNTQLYHYIYSEDQDSYYLYRRQLAETGGAVVCELRMVRADSSLFWVRLQAVPAAEGDGSPGFHVVMSDCTREKLAEIKVNTNKEQWEKTFNAMPEIITIQDHTMNIVRANYAAHHFFQAEFGELNGKHCYELFTGVSTPCSGCPLLETLQDRAEHSNIMTHEILGKIFQVSSAVIPAETGDAQYIVHVAKDITEQKKMEEKFFQSSKMAAIGTLAGGIAHDFNNILAAIMGYSELAKRDLPEDSKAGLDIDQVISSSMRAASLVRQLLTFSRKGNLQRQPLQPHLIVKEALNMLRATLPTTISIEEHIDPECGPILSDPTRVNQIVVNLCTNACQAMGNEKGALTVNLCRKEIRKKDIFESDVSPGTFIELSIQDTGQGMDKKTMARIFEPYFTTKEVGNGSGLGLAVVHGIVQELHGFMRVESKPGIGSTFHVYIPALQEAAPILAKTGPEDIRGGTERILIVDDESLIVYLYTTILEQLGYMVTATISSEEALEKVRTHAEDFDLVITDQTMLNLSGVELAREIIKIKPDMPIILCSGYSNIISPEDALALGIKKYALKPVELTTLAKLVREVLDEN
jgi:two-component system cell cycle sensor histidine kinase/response regulator CckA